MKKEKLRRRRGGNGFTLMATPYYGVVFLLILLPVLMIALYAFLSKSSYSDVFYFSLDNFRKFFASGENLEALAKSLKFAVAATIICLLIGYPFAYFLMGCSRKSQAAAVLLISAPMWINMLLRVYAIRQIFDTTGAANALLNLIGVAKIDFLAYDFVTVIGLVYIYLPFMVIPIFTTLQKIDRSYIEASLDLGATPKQVFAKIILPLSFPGVLSGITMVLLPTATTLVVPQYLSKNNYALIGNLIEMYFKNAGDWGYGAAIALIMGVAVTAMVALANKADRLGNEKTKLPRPSLAKGGKKL